MSTKSAQSDSANPSKAVFGSLQAAGLTLDLAYQGISQPEWASLFTKADQIGLKGQITELLTGGLVNTSEHRPALHTTLRDLNKNPMLYKGNDVMPAIAEVWQRMEGLCNKWVGVTDLIHVS